MAEDHGCSIGFILVLLLFLLGILGASASDAHLAYRDCLGQCQKSGCMGQLCLSNCKYDADGSSNGTELVQQPLYLRWKQWGCQAGCCYYCLLNTGKERQAFSQDLEPAAVAFSAVNLAMHFHGWLSFFNLLYYKLPMRQDKKPYYEYSSLWHIYGLVSMISWLWSVVLHHRGLDCSEILDYSCVVAVIGYSLIVAIVRTFNVRDTAERVMVTAPLVAFVITHILYLRNYKLDYGWNIQVCFAMAVAQLLLWAIWSCVTHHPSRWKLWFVVVGGGPAMLLEIYDFPPYHDLVDSHVLWHATTIPLTYLWWSFIKDDAKFRTSILVKKTD